MMRKIIQRIGQKKIKWIRKKDKTSDLNLYSVEKLTITHGG